MSRRSADSAVASVRGNRFDRGGVLVKQRLALGDLAICGDLAAWIAAPKVVGETLDFTQTDERSAASQFVDVEVDGYHKECGFQMQLTREEGRLYLNFYVAFGRGLKRFYVVGSAHKQRKDETYPDSCCNSRIVREQGYEKRRASKCPIRGLGRIHQPHLTISDAKAFYHAAAKHVHITPPDTPILTSNRENQVLPE